jgi:hypothetical protein
VARTPDPGDVRVVSDGIRHQVDVWTAAGTWQTLRSVVTASVFLRPDALASASLVLDAAFVDAVAPRDRLGVEVLTASPDAVDAD